MGAVAITHASNKSINLLVDKSLPPLETQRDCIARSDDLLPIERQDDSRCVAKDTQAKEAYGNHPVLQNATRETGRCSKQSRKFLDRVKKLALFWFGDYAAQFITLMDVIFIVAGIAGIIWRLCTWSTP